MRSVKDHGVAKAAHDGQRTHIDDEIVVPEARPALRQQDALAAALMDLVHDVAHIVRREELPLLHVDDRPRLCRRVQQIGLAREKGGDLEDVHNLRRRLRLTRLMNIGHNGNSELLLDLPQHLEPLREPRPAKAVIRRAICLVKGGLEHVGDAEPIRDLFDAASDHERAFQPLQDAWPREKDERLAAADLKIRQLHFVHVHSSFQLLCAAPYGRAASAFYQSCLQIIL